MVSRFWLFFIILLASCIFFVSGDTVSYDDFECNGFSCGTGWNGAWAYTGTCTITTLDSPQGTYQMRGGQNCVATRNFDNNDYGASTLSFWASATSLETGEYCRYYYYNGTSYTELLNLTDGQDNGVLMFYSYNISDYGKSVNAGIRMSAPTTTGDYCQIDTVTVSGDFTAPSLNIFTEPAYRISQEDVQIEISSSLIDTLYTLRLYDQSGIQFCEQNATSPSVAATPFSVICDMPVTVQTNARAEMFQVANPLNNQTKYFNVNNPIKEYNSLKISKVYFSSQVLQGGSTEIFVLIDKASDITIEKIKVYLTYSDNSTRDLFLLPTGNTGEYRAFITDTFLTGFVNFRIVVEGGTCYDDYSNKYYVVPYSIPYVDNVGEVEKTGETGTVTGGMAMHGTDYSPGDYAEVWLQLSHDGLPINNALCYMSLYDNYVPNASVDALIYDNAPMVGVGRDGVYRYNFVVGDVGLYKAVATCSYAYSTRFIFSQDAIYPQVPQFNKTVSGSGYNGSTAWWNSYNDWLYTSHPSDSYLWLEDFEDGSISDWVNNTGWVVSATDPAVGDWHMQSQGSSNQSVSYYISTVGQSGITIKYDRKLVGLDSSASEYFMASYYNGTGWEYVQNTVSTAVDEAAYTTYTFNLSSDASNNSYFGIKFDCSTSSTLEFCRVDDVQITPTDKYATFIADWNASMDGGYQNISLLANMLGLESSMGSNPLCRIFWCNSSLAGGPYCDDTYKSVDRTNPAYDGKWRLLTNSLTLSGTALDVPSGVDELITNTLFYTNDIFGNTDTLRLLLQCKASQPDPFTIFVNWWSNGAYDVGGLVTELQGSSEVNVRNVNLTTVLNPVTELQMNVSEMINCLNYGICPEWWINQSFQNINMNLSSLYEYWNCQNEQNSFPNVVCSYLSNISNFSESINETVFDIWSFTKKIDTDVILEESADQTSIVDVESDVVINYTIKAPMKEGYQTGDYVPMKIYYWFINNNTGLCESQYYSTHSATPYCDPLIVELLGKIEQNVTFVATLHPTLYKDNEYAIVREIWIDPVENGEQHWVKYASGHIGNVLAVSDTGDSFSKVVDVNYSLKRSSFWFYVMICLVVCLIIKKSNGGIGK